MARVNIPEKCTVVFEPVFNSNVKISKQHEKIIYRFGRQRSLCQQIRKITVFSKLQMPSEFTFVKLKFALNKRIDLAEWLKFQKATQSFAYLNWRKIISEDIWFARV